MPSNPLHRWQQEARSQLDDVVYGVRTGVGYCVGVLARSVRRSAASLRPKSVAIASASVAGCGSPPTDANVPPSILGEILWAIDDLAGGYIDVVILAAAVVAVLICWFAPIAFALFAASPLLLLRAKVRYALAGGLTVLLAFACWTTWSALPNSPAEAVCYRAEMIHALHPEGLSAQEIADPASRLREAADHRSTVLADPYGPVDKRRWSSKMDRDFYEIGGLVRCPVGYPDLWTFPQIRAAAWIEGWYFSERMHWRSFLQQGDELAARWGVVMSPELHPEVPKWWGSGTEQLAWFLWYTFRIGLWILGIVSCFVDALASMVVLNFLWPRLMYVLAWISPLPFAVVALWAPLASARLITLVISALGQPPKSASEIDDGGERPDVGSP